LMDEKRTRNARPLILRSVEGVLYASSDLSKDPCSFVWPEKVLLLLQHEDPPVFDWLSRTKRCSSAAHADVDPQVAALQAVPETVQKRQKRQTTVLHADDGASHISRQKARNVRNEEVEMEKEKELVEMAETRKR